MGRRFEEVETERKMVHIPSKPVPRMRHASKCLSPARL